MERRYKAFISYRHLPLETSVAKKMHRRIEHYIVPKELRKNGEKKLGLVFRDQDELPIASNLTENIEQALDRSEFLIVICSPETAKSPWVLREIDYFLKHHDRDHVLAVLADGRPEEAFPPQMTELRDESGGLVGRIEPIAANIVAPTRAKRDRLFQVESLRILSALIGCHFDALFRREQRYRRRRTAVALSAAGLIAAAFIGMLLNRNARIRAQLQQTQINESRALAALSERACGEGDYLGALRLALEALPGEGGERPYVAEAERALSGELNLYRRGVLGYVSSLEQDAAIGSLALSEDGTTLVSQDADGVFRVYDAATGAERLRFAADGQQVFGLTEGTGELLAADAKSVSLYALEDGALVWRRGDLNALNFRTDSHAKTLGLKISCDEGASTGTETVSLIDLKNGETRGEYPIGPGPERFCIAAAVDEDGGRAAFLLKNDSDKTASLYVLSFSDGKLYMLNDRLPFEFGPECYRLLFTESGDVLLGCDSSDGLIVVFLYDREKDYALRFVKPFELGQIDTLIDSDLRMRVALSVLDCRQGLIAVGSRYQLHMLDAESGEELWSRTLPGVIMAGKMYNNAGLGLILSDGTVTYCSDVGTLSYTLGINCFQSGYPLWGGAVQGKTFPQSSFVLVPDGFRQRAAAIRTLDNPAMVRIAALPEDIARMIPISSGTGARIALIGYDPVDRPVCCTVIDTAEGRTGETFALPEPELWADPGALRLTDDGLLLTDGHALDTDTRALSGTERETPPGGVAADAVWARGGDRLAVLEGRTITVRGPGGETICTAESPSGVCKLLFARGDELLISFSETGTLCVYDAHSGALLHSSNHGEENLYLTAHSARCSVWEIPEEKRLLLFCDSLKRNEAVCIALDTDSWVCAGIYEGAAAYIAASDSMLVSLFLDDVCLCPRWTLREMTEKAGTILAAAEGVES